MEYNRSEFLVETEVPEDELIISRTDLKGVITYVNDTFAEISGYTINDLIGKPHNIIRHPDMPSSVFKEMWETLVSGKKWSGFVKNMRADTGFYWVFAEVSGVYKGEELVEYKSIRTPISHEDKLKHQKLYDKIREEGGEKRRVVNYM
ncbi:MAG: PAS domain-containing protein [Campylobacterota bacterium]|nr:PAS domain-containing protein [Campylobacterota bacterium]